MTPLERAARTLPDWEFAPCPDENPDCPGGLSCPKNATGAARAVLQAIREPSAAMFAGARGVDVVDADTPLTGAYWRAMIDAALEE